MPRQLRTPRPCPLRSRFSALMRGPVQPMCEPRWPVPDSGRCCAHTDSSEACTLGGGKGRWQHRSPESPRARNPAARTCYAVPALEAEVDVAVRRAETWDGLAATATGMSAQTARICIPGISEKDSPCIICLLRGTPRNAEPCAGSWGAATWIFVVPSVWRSVVISSVDSLFVPSHKPKYAEC
jgi:hypothetical protein